MRLERGILEETPNGEGVALALAWGASRAAALRAELDRRTDLAAAPNDAIGISARRENVEICLDTKNQRFTFSSFKSKTKTLFEA